MKEYITSEKKLELENELSNLINVRRKEISESLEYAKSLGDLSENAEYSQAREDQVNCESRIAELEEYLKNAEIKELHSSNKVEVGTKIHLRISGEKKDRVYYIVGGEEIDVDNGKISYESPLGKALLGHVDGDIVS
ncbi:MAG: transcription elongation factor GreA [Cyanobium sp. MAG06]|nr:transcription elongation factor GreA [Cyanobium sp. MAG06]